MSSSEISVAGPAPLMVKLEFKVVIGIEHRNHEDEIQWSDELTTKVVPLPTDLPPGAVDPNGIIPVHYFWKYQYQYANCLHGEKIKITSARLVEH